MSRARTKNADPTIGGTTATSAQVRTLLLALVCFVLGIGVGAFWFYRAAHRNAVNVGETGSVLAESTRTILKTLAAPVELRFYSLLDPASTSDELRNFAERVDQLLAAYEQESGGKIKLTRLNTPSVAAAASTEGVKAFNLDRGEPCFLGLALTCNGRQETLAQLLPEWEAALESDLSRAIARVAASKPAARARVTSPTPIDPNAIAEVKRAVPNLESMSLADATQTLRVAALNEYAEITEAMERAVQQAEQRVVAAQNSGNEADRQAAVKQLQQVQNEHTEKLKEIAARLQGQITALQQIKRK